MKASSNSSSMLLSFSNSSSSFSSKLTTPEFDGGGDGGRPLMKCNLVVSSSPSRLAPNTLRFSSETTIGVINPVGPLGSCGIPSAASPSVHNPLHKPHLLLARLFAFVDNCDLTAPLPLPSLWHHSPS